MGGDILMLLSLGGHYQVPNTKLQIPNTKIQTPNTKIQEENHKDTKTQRRTKKTRRFGLVVVARLGVALRLSM